MKPFLNIAHRGASGHAPENTLSAFKMAIEMGANMVELDIHQTQDRELVVIHDRSLKRTTGYRGSVGRLSLKALKDLDAGAWFGNRYQGEKIPTLQEVLDLIGPRVKLNIEIKKGLRPYSGLEKRLLACLGGYGPKDQFLISCFDEAVLRRVRRLDHDIPIGYLFERDSPDRIIPKALELAAVSVHGPSQVVSERLIEQAHREGLKVYIYTINEKDEMRHWIGLGVDGLFTNYPDRLSEVLQDIDSQA